VTPSAEQQVTPAHPTVTPRTEQALREAMQRLLTGNPQRTDGRLIKDNLWKEAAVSRATMNRAWTILAEWDARVTATGGRTPGEVGRDDQLCRLRDRLHDVTRDRDRLRQQVGAAVTVIAALHADNIALREQLDRRGAVVALDQRRLPLGRPQSRP
jgi:hypothetical protein